MKNKIVIDAIPLLSSLTGIGRYASEVSKHLDKDGSFDTHYFYGYYSKKLIRSKDASQVKSLKSFLQKIPLLKKVLRKFLMLFSRVLAPKFELYWEPNFIPLDGIKSSKLVTTVHDFSFHEHPLWHPKERLDYFNTYFFKNVKRSDWIITGSEFSKREIVEYLGYPKEKITVIYHGVDQKLYKVYKKSDLQVSKSKFGLDDKFLLFVGSIEPRKNLLNLLKAYNLLSPEIKNAYPLVLVGFKGWENKELMQEIEKSKDRVRYLGYLTDLELAHTYNLATLFIYPTLYEGFGIPPLEAMACATAVIASNVASLPEVCGDAVVYCEPDKVEDIKQKITLVIRDAKLREELIDKGLKRVTKFTWENSADKHMQVFKKVLSR